MNEVLSRLEYHSNEITAIKDDSRDLRCECEGRDVALQASIDIDKIKIDELRSALDAKTESPNQKGCLEIPNRIVPSEVFLILGDIGWSEDIIKLDETNMFLN